MIFYLFVFFRFIYLFVSRIFFEVWSGFGNIVVGELSVNRSGFLLEVGVGIVLVFRSRYFSFEVLWVGWFISFGFESICLDFRRFRDLVCCRSIGNRCFGC